MMTLVLVMTALLTATVPIVSYAQQSQSSRQFAVCMDKSDGVTMKIVDCITAEYRVQDARLNRAYKNLASDLTPTRRAQLVEAQRAWIKFRDTNCNFYDDPDGGSMARVDANDCMMRSTEERATELERMKK